MSDRIFRKISVGLDDAVAFLNGDHSRAMVMQKDPDGEWHDITDEWSNTRIPHRAGSAGTERQDEASDPKGAQRSSEAG